MNIVLDTNVLVSALWSPGRKASAILDAVFSHRFTVCYDAQILDEYERVLHYPKFPFTEYEIRSILDPLIQNSAYVTVRNIIEVHFVDESDRKFYEIAISCNVPLVTGNLKHYPKDSLVMSISDFCERYL